MIFLQEDRAATIPDQPELDQLNSLLSSLHKALDSLLTANRSNQKEAKAWLINAISSLGLQDPGTRRRKFAQFLPGGSAFEHQHEEFARQLLQGLFADEPQKVARLVSREPSVLKQFFRQDPAHVRLWFGHFSMGGMAEFKHGAHALARYALLHRDEVWRLLVWGGKHPQAPVAVAQKTHYFCELDVPATLDNFLEECPQFWESVELRDSLMEGHVLGMAPSFWAQELYGWLKEYSGRSDCLFGLVCDYLESGAEWRRLCGRLLHLLPPPDLLSFAAGLLDGMPAPTPQPGTPAALPAQAASGAGAVLSGAWLVYRGARWGGLDQLAAASAVGCSLRQLGRLAREEENAAELQEMEELAEQLAACETTAAHWHLRSQLAQQAHQAQQEQAQQQQGGQNTSRSPEQGPAQQQERRRRRQQADSPAAATSMAGHQGSSQAIMDLRQFLLLHLWAAYLHLHHLATAAPSAQVGSTPAGREGSRSSALEEFRRMVKQAGLDCHLAGSAAEAGAAQGGVEAREGSDGEGGGEGEGEGGQGKKLRRREREARRKSRKKGRRRHSREGGKKRKRGREGDKGRRRKRRRRGSGSSSASDSSGGYSGSSSDTEGGKGGGGWEEGDWGVLPMEGPGPGAGLGGGRAAGQALWVVTSASGAELTMTAVELVDYVIDRLAAAHASCLCNVI